MTSFKLKSPLVWGGLMLVFAALAVGIALATLRTDAKASTSVAADAAPVALVVETVMPRMQVWPQTVTANGGIAAWQEAVVAAEVGGVRVASLLIDVGAKVKLGQVLAELDDATLRAQLAQLQAALAQARASLAQAQADAQRTRVLKDSGALSQQQILQSFTSETTAEANVKAAEASLESVQINLRRTKVVAVDDGEIISRNATLGSVVQAGTEMFRLVRQGRVEWRAEVGAEQLGRIRIGSKATVQLADGKRLAGTVRLVGPTLDAATRNAMVYVSLPGNSGARPGMYASGQIQLGEASAMVLPQSTVSLRDGRSQVFVLGEVSVDTAIVKRITVRTGRRQSAMVEILDGIAGNARVANSGVAFLNDGDRVRIVSRP